MVGVWGMPPQQVRLKSCMSFERGDPVAKGCSSLVETPNAMGVPGLIAKVAAKLMRDPSSYRPLYDLCLCAEHTRLAQAYQCLKRAYRIQRPPLTLKIREVVTDGFIWHKPRKAVTARKVEALLTGITFADLPRLEEYTQQALSGDPTEPGQKKLRTPTLHPITTIHPSEETVFRVEAPQARQHLRGTFSAQKCARNWQLALGSSAWLELSRQEDALAHVLRGGSLLVQGIAGTGKTHTIRQTLLPALEKQGKRIVTIAKTHVAAAVAGGATVDHFAWRFVREGGTGADVIWVDEVSMLDLELLCELSHASFRDPPPQWVLSGDFNQYLPFFDTFKGAPVQKSFEGSSLLHLLSGGVRLTLTECRRSEADLFEYYASLIPGGSRFQVAMPLLVAEARQRYSASKATGFIPGSQLAPVNFVLSHRLREELNAQCNAADALGRDGVVQFRMTDFYAPEELAKLAKGENHPQDALFWPGMVVVARTNSQKLKNALSYEIMAINKQLVTLRLKLDEGASHPEVELKADKFFKAVRLGYALTYASIQGVTIHTLVALHDTSHTHFDRRKLFVGASRAVASDKLIIN